MLKIIAIIAAVLVVAILGVLIAAATRPDTIHVERTIAMQAPPEKIFPHINELRRWAAWSPYEKKDPAMKRSFSGPAAGPGATYAWDGDKNVGQGSMRIAEIAPPARDTPGKVVIDLHFIRPFEANNVARFTLVPQGGGADGATRVTWSMDGPAFFITKVMGLFLDMDQMIGRDFEAGLANLKAIAET